VVCLAPVSPSLAGQPLLLLRRIIEWFGLEGTFKGHLSRPNATSRDIFNYIRAKKRKDLSEYFVLCCDPKQPGEHLRKEENRKYFFIRLIFSSHILLSSDNMKKTKGLAYLRARVYTAL